MSAPRSTFRDESGASAVEFALTAPVFFLFVFGIVEFGLLLWTQVGMQRGAELAARCATVNSTLCGTSSAIQSYAAQQAFGLNLPDTTFTATTPACGNQVSGSYSFQFPSFLHLSAVSLTAQACFPK
jgi:Flp pilus assembly protein TadG